MARDVKFNINDYVRVRLSNGGKLTHRRQHDELRKQFPSIGKYVPPKVDSDGYSRWQLWSLMQTFGPAISLGSEPPFETEIIFEVADA
jgi:hypothetical protein